MSTKKSSTTTEKKIKPSDFRDEAKKINDMNCAIAFCVIFITGLIIFLALGIYLLIAYIVKSPIYISTNSNNNNNLIITTTSSTSLKNSTVIRSHLSRNDFKKLSANQLKRHGPKNMTIPHDAIQLTRNLHYLGEKHIGKKKVKGFLIRHYKNDNKNINKRHANNNVVPTTTTTQKNQLPTTTKIPIMEFTSDTDSYNLCAGYLATGTKWKGTPPDFYLNYYNPFGFSMNYIEQTISNAMTNWQSKVSYDLFGKNDPNLVPPNENQPNGINEISFGTDVTSGDVVAQTTVWGIFQGPIGSRQIYEADITFNSNIPFGSTVNSANYYFPDIVVHELGHYLGLRDEYESYCTTVTMYGYADKGETLKMKIDSYTVDALVGMYDNKTDSSVATSLSPPISNPTTAAPPGSSSYFPNKPQSSYAISTTSMQINFILSLSLIINFIF